MKTVKTPYLPVLDTLELSAVGNLMETEACRAYIDVVNWPSYPYKPIVAFDIARTDQNLYIRYFVKGNSLKAVHDKDDSPVHQDSCVEFFMQQTGEADYMNFEFNCIGTCDAARRQSREQKQSLTAEEYALIRRYSSLKNKPFAEKRGLYSWELLVSIPFSLMGLDSGNLPQKIKANFYKCADDTVYPHFLSWHPIDLETPDFHCPPFFGEVYL
ncbi:carbohydrate-binding family 9-like protein [Parabacteroides sp. PF5-9]|uniref:carbohydrate-binding family 9-like protein n=1 Tax=Parabacteroides sp. PF5-9 TaxID=1742404 RepID=UPI002476F484|nr:carbohydrate-binding family 9-like protein [Parabacteroides sp. PF5-9]MDH6356367.1 hypothetical protein [Parabacteroides sp. PF5-9]